MSENHSNIICYYELEIYVMIIYNAGNSCSTSYREDVERTIVVL